MRFQEYADTLKKQADRWERIISGDELPCEPHPADVIWPTLRDVRHSLPPEKQSLLLDVEYLMEQVEAAKPKLWPSLECLSGSEDIIDEIRRLTELLAGGKKRSHGLLNEQVGGILQLHPDWTAKQVAEHITKMDPYRKSTTPDAVRQTKSWKKRCRK